MILTRNRSNYGDIFIDARCRGKKKREITAHNALNCKKFIIGEANYLTPLAQSLWALNEYMGERMLSTGDENVSQTSTSPLVLPDEMRNGFIQSIIR